MDKYDSKLIVILITKDYLAEDTWKKNMDYYMSLYNNGQSLYALTTGHIA